MATSIPFRGAEVRLTAYGHELRQARHRHDELTLALILAGRVREGVGTDEASAGVFELGQKPPGLWHNDHFGPGGVAAIRIALAPELLAGLPEPAHWERWTWCAAGAALPAFMRLADAVCHGAPTEALVWDAIAAVRAPHARRRPPPAWLARVHQAILDDPSARHTLSALASSAGVHPVYLARCFRSWFGCSIVALRRRRMVECAAGALGSTRQSVAEVAARSGFYDQAALANAFRRVADVTPSRYRALVSLATHRAVLPAQ